MTQEAAQALTVVPDPPDVPEKPGESGTPEEPSPLERIITILLEIS